MKVCDIIGTYWYLDFRGVKYFVDKIGSKLDNSVVISSSALSKVGLQLQSECEQFEIEVPVYTKQFLSTSFTPIKNCDLSLYELNTVVRNGACYCIFNADEDKTEKVNVRLYKENVNSLYENAHVDVRSALSDLPYFVDKLFNGKSISEIMGLVEKLDYETVEAVCFVVKTYATREGKLNLIEPSLNVQVVEDLLCELEANFVLSMIS